MPIRLSDHQYVHLVHIQVYSGVHLTLLSALLGKVELSTDHEWGCAMAIAMCRNVPDNEEFAGRLLATSEQLRGAYRENLRDAAGSTQGMAMVCYANAWRIAQELRRRGKKAGAS